MHRTALLLLLLACSRTAPPACPPPEGEVPLVAAARDLEAGAVLTAPDLVVVRVDAAWVPAGTFPDPGDVVGRILAEHIVAGDPIRQERLADLEASAPLDGLVPRGRRAVRVEGVGPVLASLPTGTLVDVVDRLGACVIAVGSIARPPHAGPDDGAWVVVAAADAARIAVVADPALLARNPIDVAGPALLCEAAP